jgi:hypothetical protein
MNERKLQRMKVVIVANTGPHSDAASLCYSSTLLFTTALLLLDTRRS